MALCSTLMNWLSFFGGEGGGVGFRLTQLPRPGVVGVSLPCAAPLLFSYAAVRRMAVQMAALLLGVHSLFRVPPPPPMQLYVVLRIECVLKFQVHQFCRG
jgi:hypothetical protein